MIKIKRALSIAMVSMLSVGLLGGTGFVSNAETSSTFDINLYSNDVFEDSALIKSYPNGATIVFNTKEPVTVNKALKVSGILKTPLVLVKDTGNALMEKDYDVVLAPHGQAGGGIPVITDIPANSGDYTATLTIPVPDGYNPSSAKYYDDDASQWKEVTSKTYNSITYPVKGGFAEFIDDGYGTIYQHIGMWYVELKKSTKDITPLKSQASLSSATVTYTGSAITPEVTITGLQKDVDYKITYSNNNSVGTAKVTITGINDYYGSFDLDFTITEAPKELIDIATLKDKATLPKTTYTYSGDAIEPEVTIPGLQKGTDFTVSYADNTNAGTATVTVTGTNNYKNSFTLNFTITDEGVTISDAKGKANYLILENKDGVCKVKYLGTLDKKATSISIPATVKLKNGVTAKVIAVADKALKGNKKVTSITVGKYVETIGASAFEECTNLKTLTLGSGVKVIKQCAVYNCKKVKTITINSKKLKGMGKNALKNTGVKKGATIKVPKAKMKDYKKIIQGAGAPKATKVKKL